jgi:hypothetical protein
MLKRLAILVLVVFGCGAWSQVPRDGSSQHDKSQDKQETPNPSKPIVVVDSQHSANNQEQAPEKPAKYPWGELLAPANIPNWFLVVVGGVTGWFVYKTLRAIKKQAGIMETGANDARESGAEITRIALATAQAARKSADAAEESAIAAMGVAVPTLILTKFAFHAGGVTDQEEWYRKPAVEIEIKNYGQSPAILKSYDIEFIWDGMPVKHFGPSGYPFLFEEEVIDAGKCRSLDPETTSSFGIADEQTAHESFVSGKCLRVYGYIRYGDIFGSPLKEMRFSKRLVEFTVANDYWLFVDEEYPCEQPKDQNQLTEPT